MQSKLVRHVGDLVLLISFARQDLQWTVLGVVAIDCRPCIACLRETTFEYLHDAVCIGMTRVRQ
jgi:hypothetical protein